MWSTDRARRGSWNDVPAAGLAGTNDISRLGCVIETGPTDPLASCGASIPMRATSFGNTTPSGTTPSQIVGASSATGVIKRTITNITGPPAALSWWQPAGVQTINRVNPAVTGAGAGAALVATMLRNSISDQIGGGRAGLSAWFAPPPATPLCGCIAPRATSARAMTTRSRGLR